MKRLGMPLFFKKLQMKQKDKVLEQVGMSPSYLETLWVKQNMQWSLGQRVGLGQQANDFNFLESRASSNQEAYRCSREDPLGAEMYQKAKDLQDSTLETLEAKVGESASQVEHGSYSIPSTSHPLVVAPTSQFDPSTREMLPFVEENIAEIFVVSEVISPRVSPYPATITKELPHSTKVSTQAFGESSGTIPHSPVNGSGPPSNQESLPLIARPRAPFKAPGEDSGQSLPRLVHKKELPWPPLASRVTGIPILRPKKKVKIAATTSISASTPKILPCLPTETAPSATAEGVGEMPPPLSSTLSTTFLPELVKKFRQIKTKLQSPSPSSICLILLQNAHRIFKNWMKKDFTASFNLKIFHDAEKALTKLYNAQLLSKA
ncbi:uncharacterized protein LOC126622606 [Malus sylvestris]|uniref:uncharacterized protein LOC126622606 n=1 Tax=Malus sylvestris TaxID=3752 RepID=UPI0021ABAF1D|nr:uncharacterized protein LOC126622606 [Malus sylvestris]